MVTIKHYIVVAFNWCQPYNGSIPDKHNFPSNSERIAKQIELKGEKAQMRAITRKAASPRSLLLHSSIDFCALLPTLTPSRVFFLFRFYHLLLRMYSKVGHKDDDKKRTKAVGWGEMKSLRKAFSLLHRSGVARAQLLYEHVYSQFRIPTSPRCFMV